MSCLDWWVLEVMVLLSGLGPQPDTQVRDCACVHKHERHVLYTAQPSCIIAARLKATNPGACTSLSASRLSCTPPPPSLLQLSSSIRLCAQVAAMGLCFNAFTLVYYAVVGFGDAACTRVSHMLGAGRGRAARRAALVSLTAGLTVCAAVCGGLAASGPAWTAAFSRSNDVRRAVRQALPYVTVAVLGYSANTVLAGVLRGSGRTGAGLRVNLVTLWLVGLPVAAGLGLGAGWGNVGLWAGIALMNVLQGGALVYKVTRGLNWAKEVVRSRSVLSLHASTLGAGDIVIGGGRGEGAGMTEAEEGGVGVVGEEYGNGDGGAYGEVSGGLDGEERAVAMGGEAEGGGPHEAAACGMLPALGGDWKRGACVRASEVSDEEEPSLLQHTSRSGVGCSGETGSSGMLPCSRREVARWLADAAAVADGLASPVEGEPAVGR